MRDGRPEITKDGAIGPFPAEAAHRRHPHHRRGRGQHRHRQRGGPPHGGSAQRGRRPGPGLLRPRGNRAARSPMPTSCWGASRRRSSAASCPSTSAPRARPSRRAWLARSASPWTRPPPASSRSSTTRWRAASARSPSGRGHDPRRFALVAFGGAGPLHACRLAELLDIPRVVIPPYPGVLSTWGLLDTDIRATFVRTVGPAARRAAPGGHDVLGARGHVGRPPGQAQAWLDGEQVPRDRWRFERAADLRYEHQSFELTCPAGEGPLTAARLDELLATFHAEHRRLYTYDLPGAPIELVNVRVTAIGLLPRRATPVGRRERRRSEGRAPGPAVRPLPRVSASPTRPATRAAASRRASPSPARPSSTRATPPPWWRRGSARASTTPRT